jgi:hypothetical protein
MSLKTLFTAPLAALALATFAAPALAADGYSAKLVTPVAAEKRDIVADMLNWTCVGDTCTTSGERSLTLRGCKDLVKAVGPVSTYASDRKALADDKLAQCNASAVAAKEADKATN